MSIKDRIKIFNVNEMAANIVDNSQQLQYGGE